MTDWLAIEAALDGILQRRWYTNHGPLVQQLEARAAERFGVRHAIAATNPTIALIMLAEAMALAGGVLLPAGAPRRCHQALAWAGLHTIVWDEAAGLDDAGRRIGPGAGAVLSAGAVDARGLAALAAARGVAFLRDGTTAHPGPCVIALPCFGDDAGIAVVVTGDDALAARLRNIRSSYGAGPPVPVVRTANGRVSELQAAMALLALG